MARTGVLAALIAVVLSLSAGAAVTNAGHETGQPGITPDDVADVPTAYEPPVGDARPVEHGRNLGSDLPEAVPVPTRIGPGEAASGRLLVSSGSSEIVGSGRVHTFVVEVEDGLGIAPEDFAETVETILFDARSWTTGGIALQRVDGGAVDFRITLAAPTTVDRQCAPLRTLGRFSCWNGARVLLNAWRWSDGAESYGDDIDGYRAYLVNHEVGHALGHGHVGCPAAGALAPVMMQQTITVGQCRPNPWPHPHA